MSDMSEMIKAFKMWPLEINKAKELLNEAGDLNLPVKFNRFKHADPLLAILESYPFLNKDLFDEYKSYDVYDFSQETRLFESNHISNEYLPVIIQLFIENGYDLHADDIACLFVDFVRDQSFTGSFLNSVFVKGCSFSHAVFRDDQDVLSV